MTTRLSLEERFWSKVDKTYDCWTWTAYIDKHGYGRFYMEGRMLSAHSVAWLLSKPNKPVPKDFELDHLCRNRSCVNPSHLEIVSTLENVLRGVGPAARNHRKTRCKRGHPFSPKNTYTMIGKSGRIHRECRKCWVVRSTEYRNKKKRALLESSVR